MVLRQVRRRSQEHRLRVLQRTRRDKHLQPFTREIGEGGGGGHTPPPPPPPLPPHPPTRQTKKNPTFFHVRGGCGGVVVPPPLHQSLALHSQLANEPGQTNSFLNSIRDRERTDSQLTNFCPEQFQQAIFDLAFIAKDDQALYQAI